MRGNILIEDFKACAFDLIRDVDPAVLLAVMLEKIHRTVEMRVDPVDEAAINPVGSIFYRVFLTAFAVQNDVKIPLLFVFSELVFSNTYHLCNPAAGDAQEL